MKAAKEWLARGLEQPDGFQAFINHWFAFNGIYGEAAGRSERDKIKECVGKRVTAQQATEILIVREAQVRYLMARPVIDQKNVSRNTSEHVRRFYASNDAVEKLTEVLMVAYQVRCNLFHGGKSPKRPRDNALCRSAAPILADVVATLI